MEKKVTLVLIFILSFVLFLSVTDTITGGITSGRRWSTLANSNLESTKIEINPRIVNAGGIITADIYPSKNGVFTGLAIYNSGGARKYGGNCDNQASADFCSETYQCIDKVAERCKTGPKCYGAKRVKIRTSENWSPGVYTVKVCDAKAGRCSNCLYPSTASFIVE